MSSTITSNATTPALAAAPSTAALSLVAPVAENPLANLASPREDVMPLDLADPLLLRAILPSAKLEERRDIALLLECALLDKYSKTKLF